MHYPSDLQQRPRRSTPPARSMPALLYILFRIGPSVPVLYLCTTVVLYLSFSFFLFDTMYETERPTSARPFPSLLPETGLSDCSLIISGSFYFQNLPKVIRG
jgi:hypothetical protein